MTKSKVTVAVAIVLVTALVLSVALAGIGYYRRLSDLGLRNDKVPYGFGKEHM